MFKKILVCLDGSSLAEQIMPYVTREATAHKGKVTLLQAVSIPEIPVPGIPGVPGVPMHTEAMLEHHRRAMDKAKTYLESLAQPLRQKRLQVDSVILEGPPGPAIVNYAKDNKIDLIAIATHGHTGLRHVVFGSVAEYVLRESGLPVLMIRPSHP